MEKKKKIITGMLVLLALLLMGFISVEANQRSTIRQEIDSGNKYLSEGRYEEAIISFNKVISIDKKNVEARVGLSKAYVALEMFDKAEAVLNEGIKLVPKKPILYDALADVFLVQNKVEQAIKILDEGYSKTKNKDLKDRLDKLSKEIDLVVEKNSLQVKNKTIVKLVRKDSNGKEIELNAEWSIPDKLGEIEKGKQVIYKAIAAGKGKVVAKIGSITKEADIEIKEMIVESIEIISVSTNGTVGDVVEFKAIVKDQLGHVVDAEPTWKLEGDIAKMSVTKGAVNTLEYIKDGTGKITVSIGKVKSTVEIIIEKRKFNIVTVISGDGTVSRTPNSDTYIDEDTITLTANPSEGWVFKCWEGDINGSNNPVEVTMDSNKNIKAIFEIKTFSLSTSVIGKGSITRDVYGQSYPYGSQVTLTAVAEEGWIFDHWEGDVTGSTNPVVITANRNKNVIAVFSQKKYSVQATTSGEGEVQKVESTTNTFKLTAIPKEGWVFDHWEGDVTGTANPVVITTNRNKNVRAVFSQKKYSVQATTSGEGKVQKVESTTNTFKLTAIPKEGWAFDHWEGDATGSTNPVVITANKDKNVKAVFSQKKYNLQATTSGEGEVQSVESITNTFELTATPKEGWEFDSWTGVYNGKDNPVKVTIDKDESIQAIFVKKQYKLNVKVNGQGAVELDNNKESYEYGEQVKLTAIPNEGWIFRDFTGDLTGSENPSILTINSDKNVDVNFSKVSVAGVIVNGKTGEPMEDVTINVKNSSGEVLQSVNTNSLGEYQLFDLANGVYFVELIKEGFITNNEEVIADDNTTIKNSSLMPNVNEEIYRFRLSWGATPDDLDLHLILGVTEVYYGEKESPDGSIVLDTDDTDGFGPETITINRQEDGKYKLFVYNYSGESLDLKNSNAKIEVFKGNELIKVINVPTEGDGLYWNVLELEGDQITEINTIVNSEP